MLIDYLVFDHVVLFYDIFNDLILYCLTLHCIHYATFFRKQIPKANAPDMPITRQQSLCTMIVDITGYKLSYLNPDITLGDSRNQHRSYNLY